MRFGLAYAAVAGAVLMASPVLACSPAPLTLSSKPVRGENCAISHVVHEYMMVALGGVTRLENGFLLQETYEGNACSGEASLLVIDCNSGGIVLLGPQRFDLMQGGTSGRMDRLARDLTTRAAAGKLTLAAASKAGTGLGLPEFARASTGQRLKMEDRTFALDCGCKTFYPDLKPGVLQ